MKYSFVTIIFIIDLSKSASSPQIGEHHSEQVYISTNCSHTGINAISGAQISCTTFDRWVNETVVKKSWKAEGVPIHLRIYLFPKNISSVLDEGKSVLSKRLQWVPFIFISWPHLVNEKENIPDLLTNVIDNQSIELFDMDSDVFLLFKMVSQGKEPYNSLWELFHIKKQIQVQPIRLSGQFVEPTKVVRRQNFKRNSLVVVALNDPDYSVQMKMGKDEEGNFIFVDGFCFHLWTSLQTALNFTYVPLMGEGWVEILENGSWVGMARQVLDDEADISIQMNSWVDTRFERLIFLMPTIPSKIFAYFRQPDLSSIRDILVGAFTPWMWFSFVSVWVLFAAVFKTFSWIKDKSLCLDDLDKEVVSNCSIFSFSVIAQQGWHSPPKSASIRIVFYCAIIVSLVCYVAFSATLVSSLSSEVIAIKSVSDLATSNLMVLGDKWAPHSHHFIREVYSKRQTQMGTPEKQFVDSDTGVNRVLNAPASFLTFFDSFLIVFRRAGYSDHFYCQTVSTVPVTNAPMPSGMFVKRGAPYKEIINHKVIMMYERGVHFRLLSDYRWEVSARCPSENPQFHSVLGINDVFTAYIILISGLIFSLSLFFLEKLSFLLHLKTNTAVYPHPLYNGSLPGPLGIERSRYREKLLNILAQ